MPLPYQNASTGQRAIQEIQKILRSFGCTKFATGEDFESGEIFIQFERQGRPVMMKASAKGYAAAWLRENPYTSRKRISKSEYETKALEIGGIAVYSVLRDWVKGQVTAIEIGVMSFEAAFLAHIMLPSGQTVINEINKQKMLSAPKN